MDRFSFWKKKEIETKVVCARCKQVITDGTEEWIGNHRFCQNCAKALDSTKTAPHSSQEAVRENCSAPDLKISSQLSHEEEYKLVKRSRKLFTIREDRTKWISEWVGHDPETDKTYRICQEAYPYGHAMLDRFYVMQLTNEQVAELAREFAPDSQYAAVLKRQPPSEDERKPEKQIIYSRVQGELHEEVTLIQERDGYYYSTLSMTDRFNAGGHKEKVPEHLIRRDRVDTTGLLEFIACKHRYMETMSAYRDTAAAKRTQQRDKAVPSTRIVIRELCHPSHAGETEYGYSLVFREGKWQFELSYMRAVGAGVSGQDHFDIPALLWDGPVYEGLNRFVIKVAHHDPGIKGRGTCKEWQKLEYLFDAQKKHRVRKERSFCLHHQGDMYQGRNITLHFRTDGTIEVVNIGWWPAHIGASNGGQATYPLAPDLFALGSVEDLIRILSENERDVDFSKLAHREDILALFKR